MNAFEQELERSRKLVEQYLSGCFQEGTPQDQLYRAMSYSLNAGGKRVRPILTMKFAKAVGGSEEQALPLGCGIEMLHTYSLIHDDLPCMDNDSLRRGKPTNHVVFGECTAVLAGDALQAAAFDTILSADLPASVRAAAALELARGAGADGMCAGQILDMEGETRKLGLSEVTFMHKKKTGALLECACVIGVLAGGGTQELQDAARAFAAEIGLAFQVRDDLLDCISTTEQMGKSVGSDRANHKSTFVTLLGEEGCESLIAECTERAKVIIHESFNGNVFFFFFSDWLAGRMT